MVLASGSPRRNELLSNLGLDYEVHPSQLDEPAPRPGESSLEYTMRLAELKTMDVAKDFPDKVVLGADTIVALNDVIMGKPKDEKDAFAMLSRLSGKTHQVVTGFCVVMPGGAPANYGVATDVDMRISTEAELRSYIKTGESMDKAGAYAIQGIGTFLVKAIHGSYSNVVGLPVARVLEVLSGKGVVKPNFEL